MFKEVVAGFMYNLFVCMVEYHCKFTGNQKNPGQSIVAILSSDGFVTGRSLSLTYGFWSIQVFCWGIFVCRWCRMSSINSMLDVILGGMLGGFCSVGIILQIDNTRHTCKTRRFRAFGCTNAGFSGQPHTIFNLWWFSHPPQHDDLF